MKKIIFIIAMMFIALNSYSDQVGVSTQPVAPHNHTSVNDGGIIKPVYDNIISGVTQTVTISGLDAIANNGYRFDFYIIGNGIPTFYYLYINGDTTLANYNYDRFLANTSAWTRDTLASSVIGNTGTNPNDYCYITGNINVLANQLATAFIVADCYVSNSEQIYYIRWKKLASVTNITSILLAPTFGNNIAINTRLRLYNLK